MTETQERAIALSVTLREREEAQKAAQREMEDMLRRLSADRRVEQLESKLMDLASRPSGEGSRLEGLEKRLRAEEERTGALSEALRESESARKTAHLEVEMLAAKLAELASRSEEADPRLEELEKRLRAGEQAQAAVQREMADMTSRLSVHLCVKQLESNLLDLVPRPQREDPRLEELEKRLRAEEKKTGALSSALRDEARRMAVSCFDKAAAELSRKNFAQASLDLAASRKLWKFCE